MHVTEPVAVDGFGRRFHYLRLSVTEVCNFRCTYCLPNGWKKSGPMDFLNVEEIARLARAFAAIGMSKIRLTGGEPSIRKDITSIIEKVADIQSVEKVAMTTNGYKLRQNVDDWVAAGLSHLNVSIDALEPERFKSITGHDRLSEIIDGIDRAVENDLNSVKINSVLLRETYDNGFRSWTDFIRERSVTVRFIELMRTGDNTDFFQANHMSGDKVRLWLEENGWTQVIREKDAGPATEYFHSDFAGRIGLIAPYARGFCDSCNRLRVSARGNLKLCLFGRGGLSLRDLLQSDENIERIQDRVMLALSGKLARHDLSNLNTGDTANLSQYGG